LDKKRGQWFGQVMRIDWSVRQQHFFGAVKAGSGPARGFHPIAGD
jgi:hypothetical protein